MDPIVTAACDLLASHRPFVLATIIQQQGSAPRTAGTRMLITAEQEIFGTIGGGLLEARTMQAAAAMQPADPAGILTFDLSARDAAAMEMICGGMVKVLLDYIQPDEKNLRLFDRWRQALTDGRRAMLISMVSGEGDSPGPIAHALITRQDPVPSGLTIPDSIRADLLEHLDKGAHIGVFPWEGGLVVADPGWMAQPLYIFGAGHVAQPTAHLAQMVGFSVVVIDDRSEFANGSRFPEAASVVTIASFEEAFKGLAVGADAYIIIVTRGHLHDRTVLAQALGTPAAYIGMIGSRRKRDALYESLLEEGFTNADISRVHCPIGLTIGADTPEEIALSIVAEMVAVRAGIEP